MEYIVTFETSKQIAEDHWKIINPTLKVNSETTIEEIHNWFDMKGGDKDNMEVKIIELQEFK